MATGAWFLFRPVDIARDAHLLEPSPTERDVPAPEPARIEVRRDSHETQSDAAIAPEPSALDSTAETCAERFRPGDLWVRWVGSDGGEVPAPMTLLVCGDQFTSRKGPPNLTRGSEQLWSLAEDSRATELWAAGQLRIQVVELFPEPGMVELAFDVKRTDPVQLVVPPHGELVVTIEDGGLQLPADSRCRVELHSDSELIFWYPREESGVIGEELRWPYLSLNTDLNIEGLVDYGKLAVSRRVVGPRREGEVCRVVLRLGEQTPILVAHLQDENENALSNSDVLLLCGSGGLFPEHRLRTMADGRVAWSPTFVREAPSSIRVEFLSELDGILRVGVSELSLPESGILDLGTVRLTPPELGFGGRVVDADGAPIEWARVQLEIVNEFNNELASVLEGQLAKAFADPARSRSRFRTTLRTDGEGRFAWLHPRAADPRSEIVAISTARFGSSPFRTFRGGEQDVELCVSKCGELRGRIPLAAPAGMRMELRLSTADGVLARRPPLQSAILNADSNENEDFRFKDLPADRYQLDVVMQAWANRMQPLKPITISTFCDLMVPAGGTCEDARLNPMDLSRELSVFSFDLQGAPSDLSISDAFIRFRDSTNADEPWAELPYEKVTKLTWMLPRGAYDFDFDLEASRRISFRGISAGDTLDWRPPLTVRLLLDAPQVSDADVEVIWNTLSYYLNERSDRALEPKFDGRTAEILMPCAGTLMIVHHTSRFSHEAILSLRSADIGPFKIEDTDVVQEFRIVLR